MVYPLRARRRPGIHLARAAQLTFETTTTVRVDGALVDEVLEVSFVRPSDGFSQVTGQWLGRRPLAPLISPAKTVEGMLGDWF